MQQKVYKTVETLIHAGTELSAGAAVHATSLGLMVGSQALIDADLNGLIAATNAHRSGQSLLRDHYNTLNQATKVAYDVACNIRDTLKRTLGRSYSSKWDGTGLNGSLQISRKVSQLEKQLRTLQRYLEDHSDLEVPTMATADIADAALTALIATDTAVNVQKGNVRSLLAARRHAEKSLHLRIRGVVIELQRAIGKVDGRWESFGLNQPGLKQAPSQPGNVTVVVNGKDAAFKWDKTPRAKHYRVWVKPVDSDEEARPIGSPADSNFTFENVPSNTRFEVSISASNNGGESRRSVAVIIQIE